MIATLSTTRPHLLCGSDFEEGQVVCATGDKPSTNASTNAPDATAGDGTGTAQCATTRRRQMTTYRQWQRDRECTRKDGAWDDNRDANMAILLIWRDGGPDMRAYRCTWCRRYHLTTQVGEAADDAA